MTQEVVKDYLLRQYLAKVAAVRAKAEEEIFAAVTELSGALLQAGMELELALEERNKRFHFGPAGEGEEKDGDTRAAFPLHSLDLSVEQTLAEPLLAGEAP